MTALKIMENILEDLKTDSDFSLWLEKKIQEDCAFYSDEEALTVKRSYAELLDYAKNLFPSVAIFSLVAEVYMESPVVRDSKHSKIELLDNFWQKVVEFSSLMYRQRLIFYTRKKLIHPSMAEDVVQDSFRKLAKAVPGEIKRNVLGWLYRTSSNRAVDVNRKEERKSLVDQSVMENIIPANEDSPFRFLLTKENNELLKDALDEILNDTQRKLLKLKYEDQLSSREIAEVAGLSENYVRKAICLTFVVLRKKLPLWFNKRL